MAKPRVFISSTFYDLRQIRVELDKFIEGLGYEPVRNEEGDIPYGKDEALQAYCYKEIANIDVLVSIIGSRYGSAGIIKEKEQEYSVSQLELKTALKEDKQVFVFIDKNVFTEYETYILNKNNENVIYKYVDNVNIYKFIEEIKALPHNNNIKGFETAEDITSYLREQFAGLFKQFMLDNKRVKETLIIRDIENTAKTLSRAGLQHAGRVVAAAHGHRHGACGCRLAHHPDVQSGRWCAGGCAGQHVLHPQASECVSERSLLCETSKTLCGLPPAPHVYPRPRKARPRAQPGHARRQPVSGSGLPAAERFVLPGHGGYQHVQPAEQAG